MNASVQGKAGLEKLMLEKDQI